jgi:hypothetical protein
LSVYLRLEPYFNKYSTASYLDDLIAYKIGVYPLLSAKSGSAPRVTNFLKVSTLPSLAA